MSLFKLSDLLVGFNIPKRFLEAGQLISILVLQG